MRNGNAGLPCDVAELDPRVDVLAHPIGRPAHDVVFVALLGGAGSELEAQHLRENEPESARRRQAAARSEAARAPRVSPYDRPWIVGGGAVGVGRTAGDEDGLASADRLPATAQLEPPSPRPA